MSDMYGAPIGIGAAEADMQKEALNSAHTRLYSAEAGLKEEQLASQQQLQLLSMDMQQAKQAATTGQVLTVNDLDKTGQVRQRPSMAEQLEQLVAFGEKQGVSPITLEPWAMKASQIRQHEASALSSEASAKTQQMKVMQEQAQRIGTLAQMGLQGPQQYARALMIAASEKLPIHELPTNWKAAQPILQGLVQQGMDVDKALRLQQQEIEGKASMARDFAAAAASKANAKVAGAKFDLITDEVNMKRKYGGEKSAEAAAGKLAQAEARAGRDAALRAEKFPALPLDPSEHKKGQDYTDRQGRLITYVGKDANGVQRYSLVKAAPAQIARQVASVEADDTDADED